MGREQVTRSLTHILSKHNHLFTKWVMLCEVIDFRMPSVFTEALPSAAWHYQPQVPPLFVSAAQVDRREISDTNRRRVTQEFFLFLMSNT